MTHTKVRSKATTKVIVGIAAIGFLVTGSVLAVSMTLYGNHNTPPSTIKTLNLKPTELVAQPLWKRKIDRLRFSSYNQTTDAAGNMVFTNDRYKVTLPPGGTEDLGKYTLNQLRVCSESIASLLGTQPYLGTTIAQKYTIDATRNISYCCGVAPDYAIMTLSTQPRYDDFDTSPSAPWKIYDPDFNVCQAGHEDTHRFVTYTSIPSWADEGLAQYVTEKLGTLQGRMVPRNIDTCLENGFTEVGNPQIIPYLKLDYPADLYSLGINGYYSALCFWDYVEKNYGAQATKDIISNLYRITPTSRSGYFIEDAVYPVIGRDVKTFLRKILYTVPN